MYFPRKVNPPAVYMYVFMTVPATVKEPYIVARGLKVRLRSSKEIKRSNKNISGQTRQGPNLTLKKL
jgi:hypothetical protein